MRKTGYGLIFLSMFCMLFVSCASFRTVNLNPRIKSGQLVQKTDNIIVLFDQSSSMDEFLRGGLKNPEETRLMQAKSTLKNMIATIPNIKINAGLRTFWSKEESLRTSIIYGMEPLVKKDYLKAIDSIVYAHGKTPMDQAILAAGNDLKGAKGHSALIIISDFSAIETRDDMRIADVMDAISKVNADIGDKLCVYAVQVGYTRDGKEYSEQIAQNVAGGYTINADRLEKPADMAAFVEKVITGNCFRYPDLAAKSKEKVVVLVASEPKIEEKIMVVAVEPKIIILAFEDIHFDFDQSTLKPEAQTILKRSIQLLKDNPKVQIRIAGYTSASGSEAHNQGLSYRRANAVKAYLIDEGLISADRLYVVGYGETNPAMYEAAPEEIYSTAAKSNMRVLFEIDVQ